MFGRLALRDLVFVTAVAGAWAWLAPLTGAAAGAAGVVADLLGVVLGLALAAAAYAGHEWGHLAGALATRSVVRAPERVASVSLFSFDSRRNTRAQFLAMSFAGFAMTGVALVVVYGLLPGEWLATRVARGGVAFLATLTVVLELPLVGYALVRPTLPPVEAFASHRAARDAAGAGVAAQEAAPPSAASRPKSVRSA